ncbi:MAG: hypothetical protein JRH20_15670 [Deltaproteobacteria bacterium]|nr:hypothetical protein [Deltaproteobacteria bacterium]
MSATEQGRLLLVALVITVFIVENGCVRATSSRHRSTDGSSATACRTDDDCTHLSDSCLMARCRDTDGLCETIPLPDGTRCSDNYCRGVDWVENTCQQGVCSKPRVIATCGAGWVDSSCDDATGCMAITSCDPAKALSGTPAMVAVVGVDGPTKQDPPIASQGQDVVVSWQVTDLEGLSERPISISYTTDDRTYTEVHSALLNGDNGGCSLNGGSGCYRWVEGAPSDGYFRLRVMATDTAGWVTGATSVPINAPQIRLLAGATDRGVGLSAKAAVFLSNQINPLLSDVGSLLVSSDCTVYFRDAHLGLLAAGPRTGGRLRVLVPTTGAQSGDGGTLNNATLERPLRIAFDHKERVLVFDHDRIRRIDTVADPMTIETIIGGGDSTADSVGAKELMIVPPAQCKEVCLDQHLMAFLALPDERIIFQSSHYDGKPGDFRVRVYDPTTESVTSIVPSGTGDAYTSSISIALCAVRLFGVEFDPATGIIQHAQIVISHSPKAPDCPAVSASGYYAALDPQSGASLTGKPHPPTVFLPGRDRMNVVVQGSDGKLYVVNRLMGSAARYDSASNSWSKILGTGVIGHCADGTLATACDTLAQDLFVDRQGRVYFVDHGQIRFIDAMGTVRTLLGLPQSTGNNGHPLRARFSGAVNDVQIWKDGSVDRIVILDRDGYRLREFTVDGSITTLAGNGRTTAPAAGSVATEEGMKLSSWTQWSELFAVDPKGDVYFSREGRLSFRKRDSGSWVDLVGDGDTEYYDSAADGLEGGKISTTFYLPLVLGLGGGSVLAGRHHYSSGIKDAMLKLYDVTDGTQSHLAGTLGAAPETICADGTSSDICPVPKTNTKTFTHATYDALESRWLVAQVGTSTIHAIALKKTVSTLVDLGAGLISFAFRRDGSKRLVYFCGIDGRLYRRDLETGSQSAYPWPVPAMHCAGRSLVYSASRDSLIFPYRLDGLSGVAEYRSP